MARGSSTPARWCASPRRRGISASRTPPQRDLRRSLGGSCWLAVFDHRDRQWAAGRRRHRASRRERQRFSRYEATCPAPSADPLDGSCWFGDDNQIVHLAANGAEIARLPGTGYISSLSVDVSDGSCWAGSQYGGYGVTHVAADGTVLWQEGNYLGVDSLSADPGDGSC
jgi:hypothetical protein